MTTIADQLRDAIVNDPRTYYRLAKDAGINLGLLGRFTAGTRGITLDTAGKLAAALGLELRPVRRKGR